METCTHSTALTRVEKLLLEFGKDRLIELIEFRIQEKNWYSFYPPEFKDDELWEQVQKELIWDTKFEHKFAFCTTIYGSIPELGKEASEKLSASLSSQDIDEEESIYSRIEWEEPDLYEDAAHAQIDEEKIEESAHNLGVKNPSAQFLLAVGDPEQRLGFSLTGKKAEF